MADPLLHLNDLHKTYPGGLHVLRGVELCVEAGDTLAIVGASGTGKSTLLNILGLLDRHDQGRHHFAGHDVASLNADQRARIRARDLGFVFQGFHLLAEFSVLENVLMVARCAGASLATMSPRARALLSAVGLEERIDVRPATLSGGERQRVALCRALLLRPRLLLADEPTGNLDPDTARLVIDQMVALTRDHGSALLVVTHDRAIADHLARRLTLREGRLCES